MANEEANKGNMGHMAKMVYMADMARWRDGLMYINGHIQIKKNGFIAIWLSEQIIGVNRVEWIHLRLL